MIILRLLYFKDTLIFNIIKPINKKCLIYIMNLFKLILNLTAKGTKNIYNGFIR
jgi:hypothetical protein